MRVYLRERLWLSFYCATAQTVSELVRELSSACECLACILLLSIIFTCNILNLCYNKHIKGNRHRVVGQNLRKNLPGTANVTGKVFCIM